MIATAVPEKTAFQPTLPSDVTVTGELLKRLKRAAHRLLNEPPYTEEYILHSVNHAPGTLSHFGDWSGDMSGRWVLALTAAERTARERYAKLADVAGKLKQCQKEDGHFGKEQPLSTTDRAQIYGNGWVLQALLEYALSTGDESFLEAAGRLGDYYVAVQEHWFHPSERMQPTQFYAKDFSTFLHALEGIVLLYRVTQKSSYLDLAKRMAESLLCFWDSDHSHNFLSTRRGLLALYGVTAEKRHLQRAEDDWDMVKRSAMIPTGGVFERFKLPGRDEGCSVADWLLFNLQLWQCTGKPRYLDLAERILLNHLYYNQFQNGGFSHSPIAPLLSRDLQEAVWCCSMHGTYALAVLPQYLVTFNESEIVVGMYSPCEVIVPWPDPVSMTIETEFPSAPVVGLTLQTTRAQQFDLKLRVPGWSSLGRLLVNGTPVEPAIRDGFVTIRRNWEMRTSITMELGYGLWIEVDGTPVPKAELRPGTVCPEASLLFGPLVLTHNIETIEGVSPALLIPVNENGELAADFGESIQVSPGMRRNRHGDCEHALCEVMGAEIWGDRSARALQDGASIAPKRLCPLYPASYRGGRFYRLPVILVPS